MTYKEALDESGMCVECKEYCSIAEPCCNTGVAFEGRVYYAEELEGHPDSED